MYVWLLKSKQTAK